MSDEIPHRRAVPNRSAIDAVTALVGFLFVLLAGWYFGSHRAHQRASDSDRLESYSDEEWADMVAFRTMPENEEIEQLKNRSHRRMLKKSVPTFEPELFDRMVELAGHPNIAVRGQVIQYLGIMSMRGRNLPYSADPTSVQQMVKSQELAVAALKDPSPLIRNFAYLVLGQVGDDRFIVEARNAMDSPFTSERNGAATYIDLLLKRKSKGE